MQYKGHSVLRTLIRCHFSPIESTGGAYIYSGSFDGLIHVSLSTQMYATLSDLPLLKVWALDGRVVQVLDRSRTSPITSHPSSMDISRPVTRKSRPCVRDVSWHTQSPILMSCAWDGDMASTVAMHEWKGYGKNAMSLEDVVERDRIFI